MCLNEAGWRWVEGRRRWGPRRGETGRAGTKWDARKFCLKDVCVCVCVGMSCVSVPARAHAYMIYTADTATPAEER